MKKSTRLYPRLEVDTTTNSAVAQAGGVMLTDTIAATRLGDEPYPTDSCETGKPV